MRFEEQPRRSSSGVIASRRAIARSSTTSSSSARSRARCVKGTRLRPESRAVFVNERPINEVTGMTVKDAYEFITTMKLAGSRLQIAGEFCSEDQEPADVYRRRPRLPDAASRRRHALRRRSAATGSRRSSAASCPRALRARRAIDRRPPARQRAARPHAAPPARPRQHRPRRRARRSDDGCGLIDFDPGAGRHGGKVVAEGTPGRQGRDHVDHRQLPRRPRADRGSDPAPHAVELGQAQRSARAQPQERDRRDSARRDGRRDRRLGCRQVVVDQRDAPSGAQPDAPSLAGSRGTVRRAHRPRQGRQGDRDRSATDRPHAAIEPARVRVRFDPRALRADAAGEDPRLSVGPVLVQRLGEARRRRLRGVQRRRRARSRCTSCRTCSSRARFVLPPLQRRHASRRIQGQEHRDPRDAGRRGGRDVQAPQAA